MAQVKKCLKHFNVCQSAKPVVEDMDEGSISNTQTAGAPGSTVLQPSNGSPPRSGVLMSPTDHTNDIPPNQLHGLRGFVGTVTPQRAGGGGGGQYYRQRRSSVQLPLESVESPPLAPPSDDFGSASERPPAALHYVSGPIGHNNNKPHFPPTDSPLFRNTANASFTYSNLDNSGYAEAAATHNNNYFGTVGRSGEGHRHEAATHRNQHAALYDPTSVQTISLAGGDSATPTRAMRADPAFAETPPSGQIYMPRFESIEARHPTLEEHTPTTQQNQPASQQSKNRRPSRILSPDSQPGFSTVLQFAPLISVVKPVHSSAADPQADVLLVDSGGAGSSAAATRKTTYHGNNKANAAASSFNNYNNNNTLSDLSGTARSGSGVVTAMDELGNSVSLARTSPGYGNSPATYHRRRLGSGVFNAPMPMLSFSNRLQAMDGSASEVPGAGESSSHYLYGPGRPSFAHPAGGTHIGAAGGITPVSTPRNLTEVPGDIQRLVTIFTSALTTSSEQQSPARQSSTSQQDYYHQEVGLPALSAISIGANGGLLSPHQQALASRPATTTSNEPSTGHHNASILSLDSGGQSSGGAPAKKAARAAKQIQKPKKRIEARLTNGPPESTLFQHPAEKLENDARQERKPLVVVNENEFDWLIDSVLGAGESSAAYDRIEFESPANASGGEF